MTIESQGVFTRGEDGASRHCPWGLIDLMERRYEK
jgi:hypothetical protein